MVAEWYIVACGGDAVALLNRMNWARGFEKGTGRRKSTVCQDSNPIWAVGLASRNMLRFLGRTTTKAVATTVGS